MVTAREYWDKRYSTGGNSGSGSMGDLLSYKASVLSSIIKENRIKSGLELGSGDGKFANLLGLEKYVGYDISKSAVSLANKHFVNPDFKTRARLPAFWRKFDITLSIDVIYHILDEADFQKHMFKLFSHSKSLVIIYSYPKPSSRAADAHIKFNDFVSWAKHHASGWELIDHFPNKFPFDVDNQESTSESEFFIYGKLRKRS